MKPGHRGARGFTYLGVLFIVFVLGLVAAAAGPVWRVLAQRDAELELLFAGRQFRAAIESYRRFAPGGGPSPGAWPQRLEDLLRDARSPATVHHLRRLYADPMTRRVDWLVLRNAEGGIVGIASRSLARPIRQAGFAADGFAFQAARSYRDWRFVAAGATPAALAADPPEPPPPQAPAPEAQPAPEADSRPPPALPRPPRPSDFSVRSAEACRRIEAYDGVLCAQQRQLFGVAAGNDCD
jgi:type II secretory pathway pseudopilin PulG